MKGKNVFGDVYWLYGKHVVDSAINNSARKIFKLLVTKTTVEYIKKYKDIIEKKNIAVEVLENNKISKYIGAEESVHQGIAIKVKKLELFFIEQLLKKIETKSILLFLDHVTDPQNVGAIIRSSLAFRIDAVITTKDNAPSENANLVKASSGAFELMPYIQVTNLTRTLCKLKKYGYWIIAITQDGDIPISKVANFNRVVLLMGAEGKGIRNLNLQESDIKARIEISNKLQSLNVSSAAAIALYQISLKR